MVVPSLLPTDKAELRKTLRARRRDHARSLDPDALRALQAALAEDLAPLFAEARVVAGYSAMDGEIDPSLALARAAAAGCRVALPHFDDRQASMNFRAGEATRRGPWGIPEPEASAPIVTPDLVLMPLVAIDRSGHRVGMGMGHYDRALAALPAQGVRLIGLGWEFQLLDNPIASDPWDVPLDGFASPAGLEMFR